MNFKTINELLNKLNEEYKVLLDVIDNQVLIIDNNLNILFINQKGRKNLKENFLMQHCSILKTANCKTDNCCIKRYLAGLKPLDNIRENGIVEKVTVSPFYDNQGQRQGYIIVSTDVSELVKMKKELLISEEIYKLALTQSKTTLWQYDVNKKSIEQLFSPKGTALGILDVEKKYYNIPESLVEAKIISKEDGKRVKKLCQNIEKGCPETEIELKMKNSKGVERWIKLKCTTIFDDQHQPIKSIGIGEDITEIINLRAKYQIEREYRDVIGKDALCYMEVNLTENKIVSRKIAANNFINFYTGSNYERSIEVLSENVIKNKQGKLLRELKREHLLEAYHEGRWNQDFEYQFYNKEDEDYHFVKISVFLINVNGDIYACSYINDINDAKVENLDLQKKAELDPLTGLYNRKAIETKINYIIKEFPKNRHALMVLDIDNFKAINDNLGHLYGDALLCEIARKIKSRFRNDDLIARLGGDEYLILMKNISNNDLAIEKAKDLCKLIEGEYGTGALKIKVTISVGIALYPETGESFDDLYHHGDQALYKIKNSSKNGVCLYDKQIDVNSKRKTDSNEIILKRTPKKFSDNVGEYIFRILYNCQDVNETVTAVLELLGMHYNMYQNMIFIKDLEDGKFKLQNYWSFKQVPASIRMVSEDKLDAYFSNFDKEGVLWIDDIDSDKVSSLIKEIYLNTNIKMIINYLIKNDQEVIGIISMEYQQPYYFTSVEKERISTAIAIINTFIVKQYQENEKNRYLETIQLVLDFQNNGIYIIDPSNYKLVYYNNKVRHIFNNVKSGDVCYKAFRGFEAPCPDCPIKDMKDSDQTYTKLLFNSRINSQLETTVRRVHWINGQEVVAITSIDITKYYCEK